MDYQNQEPYVSVAQLSGDVKTAGLNVTLGQRYSGTLPAYIAAPEANPPELTPSKKPASAPPACKGEAFAGVYKLGDDGDTSIRGGVSVECGPTKVVLEKTEDATGKVFVEHQFGPHWGGRTVYESNGKIGVYAVYKFEL